MTQSVGTMNGLYRGVVMLEAEPDEESHLSQNSEYAERVKERAINMALSRQPVQHPSGNGSPEHGLGMQRYPQQVHLPPNMPYPAANHQQGPNSNQSVEYCHYHGNQDSGSFFIPTFNSANGSPSGQVSHTSSTPQVLYPPMQNGVYGRSISTPDGRPDYTKPQALARNQRPNTTPTRKMHHSGDSRSSMGRMQSNGSNGSLSQYGQSSYGGSTIPGLDNMTGLQQSLTDISQPESIEPSTLGNGSKRHSTESYASDDISFRTVHPSYEESECSGTQSHNGRLANNIANKENGIRSISANIRPQNGGSNNMTVSTQPYSPTPPGGVNERRRKPTGDSTSSNSDKTPKATVFITYANEAYNQNHIRTVVQIAQTLMKNSIDISVDMLEETMRSMSISEWLEEKITKSDFVLICISPGYKKMVDMEDGTSVDTLNTKYIYRRIHNEYIRNGSKNYRFIPVLLSDGRREHIPHWLCDTKVYNWPKDYSDIIFRLYRIEKYVKPPLGERPVHTVEQYSSIGSQAGPSHRPQNSQHR